MENYFTSDLHLDHANIIKYANRPFSSAGEMNEAIIKNFNSKVKPNDNLYIIGDVLFAKPERALALIKRLNGHKFLIRGNHDKKMDKEVLNQFQWVKDLAEIYIQDKDAHGGKQMLVLCHYAMRVWNKSHHGTWHLYGHSHGSLPDDPSSLSIDVGVDCHNFSPLSYQDVKRIMSKKTYKPVDHHGAD